MLEGTINPVGIIGWLLAVIAGGFCGALLLRLNKMKQALEFQNVVTESSHGGYYIWHPHNDQEIISPSLQTLMDIRQQVTSFQQLITYIEEGKEELISAYSELQDAKINHCTITLSITINNTPKHLKCYGHLINNEKGVMHAIIFWFSDVSDHISLIQKHERENLSLVCKLEAYRRLMDALPYPVWQCSEGEDITFYNNSFLDITSSAEEEYGVSIDQGFMQKSSRHLFEDNHSDTFSANQSIVVGGQRRLYQYTHVLTHPDSKEISGYALDLSEKESLEKQLEQHLSTYRGLLESSSNAMAIYEKDGRLQLFNQSFMKLWGFNAQWLNSKPTYSQILEALRKKRRLPEQADFQNFRKKELELFHSLTEPHHDFLYLPDGRSLRVTVIPHVKGLLIFSYEDLTDKLAIESSYNTLVAVQKETLDHLDEGIVVIGENGCVDLYNPKFTTMWPEVFEEIQQKPHISDVITKMSSSVMKNKDWKAAQREIAQHISTRQTLDYTFERQDGKQLQCRATPLPDGATLLSFVDVSASALLERSLRERNEALEEADRLKTEFLANISYELRTPLTTIMGFTEVMMEAYFGELTDKQKEYIVGIFESSNQLMSLINDILDLTSIEAGYMVLDIKPIEIRSMVLSIMRLLQQRCDEMSIQMELKCDKNIGNIHADEHRIRQALYNIISNAVKFTSTGGHITITITRRDKWVEFIVTDNGIGIPQEDQEKVFEKFYRTESAWLLNKSGTGLGLSVAKQIISLHEGTIELTSQESKGTVVTCLFKANGPEDLSKIRRLRDHENTKRKRFIAQKGNADNTS